MLPSNDLQTKYLSVFIGPECLPSHNYQSLPLSLSLSLFPHSIVLVETSLAAQTCRLKLMLQVSSTRGTETVYIVVL